MVATRGSRLSLAQTAQTLQLLQGVRPGARFEILRVTTRGDRTSEALFRMNRRGIFEKEVDQAVADGRADFAVHSMKDVPTSMPPGLVLASVPARHPPNDVILFREGLNLEDPPPGMLIGTSSLRRMAQARLRFGTAKVLPMRGNVDTRVSKIGDPYDAIILAKAGIGRLGIDRPHTVLPTDEFVPSPGQGALAIVAREGDDDTISLLRSIQDGQSRAEAEAERALSTIIESGCRFPVGACARTADGTIRLECAAYSLDGSDPIRARAAGTDPRAVGEEAGRSLLERGASSLALKWRQEIDRWT